MRERERLFDQGPIGAGLVRAFAQHLTECTATAFACEQAEQVAPAVADYPYARATVLWQRGERDAALTAARRTLEINPNHGQARALIQQTGR